MNLIFCFLIREIINLFILQAFPILWSVMNDCSQENYSATIRNGLANFLVDNQPETIHYNFDERIFYALRRRYETTRIKGTFEAYCNVSC